MSRPFGSKNKPKGIKAPEANGLNGKSPLTEAEYQALAKKVEEEIVMDSAPQAKAKPESKSAETAAVEEAKEAQ